MKVIELKEIVNVKTIKIYTDFGIYDEFKNESTEESIFINKEGESPWKLYGECEIEQLYVELANSISIDLK